MIKFTASGNGRTIIGLGLEAENIKRMQQGQLVRVRLSDLGFTGALATFDVLIFTGKDAETMRHEMAALIGPDTVVHDERPDPPVTETP